jgi:hypothetical protein
MQGEWAAWWLVQRCGQPFCHLIVLIDNQSATALTKRRRSLSVFKKVVCLLAGLMWHLVCLRDRGENGP